MRLLGVKVVDVRRANHTTQNNKTQQPAWRLYLLYSLMYSHQNRITMNGTKIIINVTVDCTVQTEHDPIPVCMCMHSAPPTRFHVNLKQKKNKIKIVHIYCSRSFSCVAPLVSFSCFTTNNNLIICSDECGDGVCVWLSDCTTQISTMKSKEGAERREDNTFVSLLQLLFRFAQLISWSLLKFLFYNK